MQFSRNISKHDVNRLEAAVDSTYLMVRGLSCDMVPTLIEFINNGSSTAALTSLLADKDLSDD